MIKIKNCALFGGTFDPFHNGHLHLIRSLLATKKFDGFVVIPAGNPYKKTTQTSGAHRIEMARLALQGLAVEISDCEVRRSGSSYAIDTVKELKDKFPAERYTWVIGTDAFAGLATWESFEELISIIDFLVVIRPGTARPQRIPGVRYEEIEIGALDISSTIVRNHLRSGKDVTGLIPEPVVAYIKENNLYGAA